MHTCLISLVVCLSLWVSVCQGVVTFGQAAEDEQPALLPDFTIPITVTSGTNAVMFAGFCTANGVANEVSTITFNTVPLTLITEFSQTGAGLHVYLYRLVNPPVVASSVSVTLTTGRRMAGGVIILHGVHQTTPTDGQISTTNTGATTSISVNVPTDAGDMVVDVGCKRAGSTPVGLAMQAQSARSERYNISSTSATAGNNIITGGSTRTGTGSLTMNWAGITSDTTDYGVAATNVNQAVVAAPTGGLSLGFKLLR